MVDKVVLNNVGDLTQTSTAQTTINNNFAAVQAAINNTLSRDGSSPNQMISALDMNSNQIFNLPAPSTTSSPARLIDVASNPTITIPGTGVSGHVVPFLDGNNTWSGTNVFAGSPGVASYRQALTADQTYFVDVNLGNDANDGLAVGSGRAFRTINHAISVATAFDLYGKNMKIKLADGTYPENVSLGNYVGRTTQGHTGPIIIEGNTGNISAVTIAPPTGNCFTAVQTGGFEWDLQYLRVTSTNAACIYADAGAWVCVNNINFASSGAQHMAPIGGFIEVTGNYTISGSAQYHVLLGVQGKLLFTGGQTVTVAGTPVFTNFLLATNLSFASIPSSTIFSGAAIGQRYQVTTNSVVDTGGSGATFLPGNAAGVTSTGGIYA